MFKQIVIIILISLAAIFFRAELSRVLDYMVYLHNYFAHALQMIFSGDAVGRYIQDVIALLVIPLIGGGIVALIFWMIKREALPHIMGVIWVVWLVLLVTMIAQTNVQEMAKTSSAHTLEVS